MEKCPQCGYVPPSAPPVPKPEEPRYRHFNPFDPPDEKVAKRIAGEYQELPGWEGPWF